MDYTKIRNLVLCLVLAFFAQAIYAQSLTERGFHWDRVLMDGSRTDTLNLKGTQLQMQKIIDDARPAMAYLKEVIGQSEKPLSKYKPESPLSNWYADMLLEESAATCGEQCDISLGNFGGIRIDMPEGDVIVDDMVSMFPFDNKIVIAKIKGDSLMVLLNSMAVNGWEVLGGVRIIAEEIDGKKQVVSAKIGGKDLEPEKIYSIISNDFLLDGGDGVYLASLSQEYRKLPLLVRDLAIAHIRRLNSEGRKIRGFVDDRISMRYKLQENKLYNAIPGYAPSYVEGAKTAPHRLNILHSNDTHSHIEAIRSGRYSNCSGILERAAFVDSVRTADKARNVLLLDAGDFEQGTTYFTVHKGKVEIDYMNKMGYDVVTLGNHQFDNGSKALAQRLKKARFKVVLSNYDLADKDLEKLVKPYAIVRRGGLKIGIVGALTDLGSLVDIDKLGGLRYLDPVEHINSYAAFLKERKGCDMVIMLSHLGLNGDKKIGFEHNIGDLEIAPKLHNVDLIIGGHSHSDLKAPIVLKDADGKDIVIVHDFCWGIYMGEVKIN